MWGRTTIRPYEESRSKGLWVDDFGFSERSSFQCVRPIPRTENQELLKPTLLNTSEEKGQVSVKIRDVAIAEVGAWVD